MIEHATMGVPADMTRAAVFCDVALGTHQLRCLMELPERSGADGTGCRADYGLKQHGAFGAGSRAEADALHAAALKAHRADMGARGLRAPPSGVSSGYRPGCCAALAIDPDGDHSDAVSREGRASLVPTVSAVGSAARSPAAPRGGCAMRSR